jgi:hypothetical protein
MTQHSDKIKSVKMHSKGKVFDWPVACHHSGWAFVFDMVKDGCRAEQVGDVVNLYAPDDYKPPLPDPNRSGPTTGSERPAFRGTWNPPARQRNQPRNRPSSDWNSNGTAKSSDGTALVLSLNRGRK